MMKPSEALAAKLAPVFSRNTLGKFVKIRATPWSSLVSGVYFVVDVQTQRGRKGSTVLVVRDGAGSQFSMDWRVVSGAGETRAQVFSVEVVTCYNEIRTAMLDNQTVTLSLGGSRPMIHDGVVSTATATFNA